MVRINSHRLVFAASVSLLFAGQHPARGLQASPEIEKNIKEYQSELEFAEKKLASVDSQIKTGNVTLSINRKLEL